MKWTADHIPDQADRLVMVTGASSGLGLETAKALTMKGATVILACISRDLAHRTRQMLLPIAKGPLEILELDLACLDSVEKAANAVKDRWRKLDLLVNNAGVMGLPRSTTEDGFERHFGINYLGHFALTRALLPIIRDNAGARVVSVTSIWHHYGRINFNDLHGECRYSRWDAYAQSKLAITSFALELQSRLAASGSKAASIAVHPGYARTGIQAASVQASGSWLEAMIVKITRPLFQSAAQGALPQLYAATAPNAVGGELYAPNGLGEGRGWPRRGKVPRVALNPAQRKLLWDWSVFICEMRNKRRCCSNCF